MLERKFIRLPISGLQGPSSVQAQICVEQFGVVLALCFRWGGSFDPTRSDPVSGRGHTTWLAAAPKRNNLIHSIPHDIKTAALGSSQKDKAVFPDWSSNPGGTSSEAIAQIMVVSPHANAGPIPWRQITVLYFCGARSSVPQRDGFDGRPLVHTGIMRSHDLVEEHTPFLSMNLQEAEGRRGPCLLE
jgi:hypothetical protein